MRAAQVHEEEIEKEKENKNERFWTPVKILKRPTASKITEPVALPAPLKCPESPLAALTAPLISHDTTPRPWSLPLSRKFPLVPIV